MSITNATRDDALGMAWWNGLSEQCRLHWLLRAGSDVPADAWAIFKAGLPRAPDFPNRRPDRVECGPGGSPQRTKEVHDDCRRW